MRIRAWCAVAAAALLFASRAGLAAEPATVDAPALKAGDSWVVDDTTQAGAAGFTRRRNDMSIERLNSDSMVVASKQDGAATNPQNRIVGLDWSLRLAVDGEQKITARPLSFPMKVGQSWTSDWIDPRRQGNQVSAHWKRTFKVVGWEDVTVPAGTFHCLKIEANGTGDIDVIVPSVSQSTAVGEPGAATGVAHVQKGGRGMAHVTTYSAIWYAPEVKYFAKEVDEQYNGSEVMIRRDTEELVSFKPAG